MASSFTQSIPPLNRIYIISTWIEAALWGTSFINVYSTSCSNPSYARFQVSRFSQCGTSYSRLHSTVVFAVVCHLLFGQLRGQRNKWYVCDLLQPDCIPTRHDRILFGTSALLYICATINVSASLRQELEAFIFIPSDAPSYYASFYYANQSHGMALLKNSTYAVAVRPMHTNYSSPALTASVDVYSRYCLGTSPLARFVASNNYRLAHRLGECTSSGHTIGRSSCYR